MNAPAIEISRLTKQFGRVRAVDDLSLSVPEGALFGLIGPNGAGKTTTFSLLSGFLKPTSGTIVVRGEALRPGVPPVGRIAMLPQDAAMPANMTSLEVSIMLGRFSGFSKEEARERGQRALTRLGLRQEEIDKRVGQLSHGQRRRVGIAQAMIGDGEIILLDEPTAGLDPLAAAELRELVKSLRGHRTIVISSHNLAEIESLCDHAAILARGKLASAGTMDELRRASTRVTIQLAAQMPESEALLAKIRAMPGVRGAQRAPDGKSIDLELAEDGEAATDALTNAVLRSVMESGGIIRGVDRGERLEQRFIEETRRL